MHPAKVWNASGYFSKTTFKQLGYRFQLGHPPGESCSFPIASFDQNFTVIDINGIHSVSLDFCGCNTPPPHCVQLLRFGWYPATVGFPRSAATYRVLKTYQMLSFESKASAFEYYQSLARLTDNTGILHIPVRHYLVCTSNIS